MPMRGLRGGEWEMAMLILATWATSFLARLWERSWQGAVAAALVVLADFLLRRRLSAKWRCGLWALALVALAAPSLPISWPSLFHLQHNQGRMFVRSYDIHDLLVDFADFDQPPTAPATRPDPALTLAQRAQDIIQYIESSVAPDSWATQGDIRESSGQLIVRQTAQNHELLADLLEQLRVKRATQITVQLNYVVLNPADLSFLNAPKSQMPTSSSVPGRREESSDFGDGSLSLSASQMTPTSSDGTMRITGRLLDDAQADEIVRIARHGIGGGPGAPRITLSNGQRAYMEIGTQRAYISGYRATSGNAGKMKFEPIIDVVSSGLFWDMQATVCADRRCVTMILRPTFIQLDHMVEVPWPGSPANQPLMMPRPVMLSIKLTATATVPDGATLLLGGFEEVVDGEDGPAAATRPTTGPTTQRVRLEEPRDPNEQMFLLVKPIINLPPYVKPKQNRTPAATKPN